MIGFEDVAVPAKHGAEYLIGGRSVNAEHEAEGKIREVVAYEVLEETHCARHEGTYEASFAFLPE